MQEQMSFDEFEKDWLRKHRGSIPRKRRVSTARGWFWTFFWIIVAAGAAVYSAAHTIPAAELTILRDVPNRSELALSVFAIVELLIFGAAAKRHDIDWLRYVMLGAVLVALVSNVGSSVLAVNLNGGNLLNQLAGVLLSILAPISALAAGEVLHIEQDKRDAAKRAADEEYEQAKRDLDTKINTAYKKYEKEIREARQEADRHAAQLSALSVRPDTDSRQTRGASYGYVSTPDGQLKVMAYLDEHPDAASMGSRALASLVGVSHDTANKGRNAWAAKQNGITVSTNGNGTHD